MHLWLEVVEHRHAVVARDQRIDEMRADVAGAAGDEDRVEYSCRQLRRLRRSRRRVVPHAVRLARPAVRRAPIDASADRAISRCRAE